MKQRWNRRPESRVHDVLAVVLFWCAAWAGCGDGQRVSPPAATVVDARPAPADRERDSAAPDLSPLQQPLAAEAPERDPRSARVRLKLFVQPVEAEVFWGRKSLGVAGRKALELERPRGSGPVDLVVRAPGFLPFHTRLLGDRDDTLTVRLVTADQARGLWGFRPGTTPGPGRPPGR
jgi:hypothetical protein